MAKILHESLVAIRFTTVWAFGLIGMGTRFMSHSDDGRRELFSFPFSPPKMTVFNL